MQFWILEIPVNIIKPLTFPVVPHLWRQCLNRCFSPLNPVIAHYSSFKLCVYYSPVSFTGARFTWYCALPVFPSILPSDYLLLTLSARSLTSKIYEENLFRIHSVREILVTLHNSAAFRTLRFVPDAVGLQNSVHVSAPYRTAVTEATKLVNILMSS